MLRFKQFIKESEDYKGQHTAPGPDFGDPLHDVTRTIYPEDFYSSNGRHFYGDGSDFDNESHNVMSTAKGKPNHPIKIYRAVPYIQTKKNE